MQSPECEVLCPVRAVRRPKPVGSLEESRATRTVFGYFLSLDSRLFSHPHAPIQWWVPGIAMAALIVHLIDIPAVVLLIHSPVVDD